MPAKKGPILTFGGRNKRQPMPIKPGPKGGKNPKLPYRNKDEGFAPKGRPAPRKRTDPGFGPKKRLDPKKRPLPVKPKGNIRDLLYRAKPGEVKKQRVEQIRKSKYDQMIEKGQISMMRRPDLGKKNKLQDMLKGYRPAPDNSKVTYKTRVKPKGMQRVMDAPFRIKNTTVKTGRGR